MLFNSLQFVVFFVVVYGLYLVLPLKGQNRLLLVASYIFYGAWDYRFLTLLLASTVVDYWMARMMAATEEESRRKRLLLVSIVVNLTILGFFKYYNFFADSAADLLAAFGMKASPFTLNIVLPVGISFYTFQTLSYTIDVYRRRMEPCRSLADFALYVELLSAARRRSDRARRDAAAAAHASAHGHCSRRRFRVCIWSCSASSRRWSSPTTCRRPLIRSSRRRALFPRARCSSASLTSPCRSTAISPATPTSRAASARMLGIELMKNFNLPYFARNPSDFWRRWHISLSTWLRDYLYIPLGGNKGSKLATYRNLLLTMLLGGLWHGAAWNFVLWGAYQGLLLIGHRLFQEATSSGQVAREARGGVVSIVPIGIMLMFTLYGWLLFRASSFGQVVEMTAALTHPGDGAFVVQSMAKLAFYAWPIWLLEFLEYRRPAEPSVLQRAPVAMQAASFAALSLLFIVLGNYEGASFIYFQF